MVLVGMNEGPRVVSKEVKGVDSMAWWRVEG